MIDRCREPKTCPIPGIGMGAGWKAGKLTLALLAYSLIAPEQASAQLMVERAQEAGLRHTHRAGFDRLATTTTLDWLQSGVAMGDLDGDGDLDVVACGGVDENHVFRNDGDGTFTDVTRLTGMETGDFDRAVTLGDYDRDGDLDVALLGSVWGEGATTGRGRLYRNQGNFRFDDVTHLVGPIGFGHSVEAKWVDLDLDGLLDLYVGEFHATENAFYLNQGDGTFKELGVSMGLNNTGSTHVVGVLDSDRNGYPDVYVGNDYGVSTSLMNNSPDVVLSGTMSGSFLDTSLGSNCAPLATTMGISFGDVDYDGLLDVYKTEFGPNILTLNNGWPQSGTAWTDATVAYGVLDGFILSPMGFPLGRAVGWGTAFTHLDLDPWVDLLMVNGKVGDSPGNQPNRVWQGQSPATGTTFVDMAYDWGVREEIDDRGISIGDIDRDGDVDVFIAPVTGPLRFYENNLDRGRNGWLRVEVHTTTSAPGGGGSIVRWTDALGYPHVRPILADGTTAGQNAAEAFFGLGEEESVDVTVEFPSGVQRTYPGVEHNSTLIAREPRLIQLQQRTASTADAGNLFLVQALAHDALGNPLDGTAVVTIDMPGLTPATPVTHVRGNMFEREFVLPAVAGEFRASVSFDSFQVLIRPRLVVTGSWDQAETIVVAKPASGRANSTDTVRLHVTPCDSLGRALGAGQSVSLTVQSPLGAIPVAMKDAGDGSYLGLIELAMPAGLHPLLLSVNGAASQQVGNLEVAGVMDPAMTASTHVIEQAWPGNLQSAPHVMRHVLTPKDASGLRIGPREQVSLQIIYGGSSERVSVRKRRLPNGEVYFVVERGADTPMGSAYGNYVIRVNGQVAVADSFTL